MKWTFTGCLKWQAWRCGMAGDYISREAALEITTRTCGDYAAAFAEIRKLPAADVAEVVRCKDCIYNIDGMCFSRTSFKNAVAVEPDNFAVGARPNERPAV